MVNIHFCIFLYSLNSNDDDDGGGGGGGGHGEAAAAADDDDNKNHNIIITPFRRKTENLGYDRNSSLCTVLILM